VKPEQFDLAIVGAGAAGLIAADLALQLRARTVLLERERIGGDCTWSGCVPSKALVKAAAVAAGVRGAARFGIRADQTRVEFAHVHEYLRSCVQRIYAPTAPEALRARGLEVRMGAARFVDAHTLEVAGQPLQARRILICTGARPREPALPGLDRVPHLTYRQIFEHERLPQSLIVVGGGPLGCEIAQSYGRLGSRVTLLAPRLLPRVEPEAAELLSGVFAAEGLEHRRARALAARCDGEHVQVRTEQGELGAERLLIAVGRVPDVADLALERAGVRHSERGIEVNARLQTSARHIYAAGDVLGGAQFSHLAGWQAFHAVRNALLPGGGSALASTLPEVTFTDPEVAHVGLTEAQARARFGARVQAGRIDLAHVDRAVSEDDRTGLIKLVAHRDGRILGATVMAARGGEALTEIGLAICHRLTLRDLAAAIHPYPTYNSAKQLLATRMATARAFAGARGALTRALSRWTLRT